MPRVRISQEEKQDKFACFLRTWKKIKTDAEFVYLSADGYPNIVLRVPTESFEDHFTPAFASPLAKAVKSIREKMGMSQRELARASGLSQMTISYLEASSNPSINNTTLNKLAEGLKMPLDDLYKLVNEQE